MLGNLHIYIDNIYIYMLTLKWDLKNNIDIQA